MEENHSGNTPAEVDQFQMLWFLGMIIGALYDIRVAVAGDFEEAGIDIFAFAAAMALMFLASQRRNLARFLLVPFLLLTVIEVLSHDHAMKAGALAICLMGAQIVTMTIAVALLFTRAARAWFLGARHDDVADGA